VKKIKIAISGKANTGKDTLSKLLIKELGTEDDFYKTAFADPMKKIIMDTFPSAEADCLWGPSEKRSSYINNIEKINFNSDGLLEKNYLTYRESLLDLGKLGRYYDKDMWVLAAIFDAERQDKNIIISDLRFKNELNHLKNRDFILIRLIRTNNEYQVDDISDKDLDDVLDSEFNYTIINDSDFETFSNKIKELAAEIKEKY